MGKSVVEVLTDDISGDTLPEGEGRTVRLAVDEAVVEVDLSNQHIDELEEAIGRFLTAGRVISGPRQSDSPTSMSRPTPPRQTNNRDGMKEVRAWARRQGYSVSARGRIPMNVMDAYARAHLPRK